MLVLTPLIDSPSGTTFVTMLILTFPLATFLGLLGVTSMKFSEPQKNMREIVLIEVGLIPFRIILTIVISLT